jgi:hypothetical protein
LREEGGYLLLKPVKKAILTSNRPGNWQMSAGKLVGVFGQKDSWRRSNNLSRSTVGRYSNLPAA